MIDLIQQTHGKIRPTINCLDHGFVSLRDCMPRIIETEQSVEGAILTADPAITEAARVSYQKGTKSVNEDRGLIRYLYRHAHTTPFEMVEFKFHCSMPIFVARQWIRHRTANVNEMSGRYSILPNEFYLPGPEGIRAQSKTNKQGSEGQIEETDAQGFSAYLAEFSALAYEKYEDAINRGVGREQARMLLPTNLYTSWYWKIDLHNLLHFLKLRCDAHAQYEIRVFADAILDLIKPLVPWSVEAWEDYCPYRSAITLSRLEKEKTVATSKWLANQKQNALRTLDEIVTHGKLPEELRHELAHLIRNFVREPDLSLDSGNKREDAEWTEKAKKMGLIQP